MKSEIVCFILGGGAGTRLYPLTDNRSKPAVPIGGKYRLIDIPVSNCLNSGVHKIFVLTQFNSASLNQHIKNTYNFDIFSAGFVDILAAEQTRNDDGWFRGTADAVRQCMKHLRKFEAENILILSGDQLYQMDLKEFNEYHNSSEADITIATIPVTKEDATGFGIMKVDKGGYVQDFVEKPDSEELQNWKSAVSAEAKAANKDYLASMGIYLFSKESLQKALSDNPDAIDFGKEIIPKMIKEDCQVASYPYEGYWEDIGTIKSFFDANIALTDNIPEFNLHDGKNSIYTHPRMLPPTKLFGTNINKALISEGSIIHADSIETSVIGIRSRIEKGVRLKNVVVFGNDTYENLDQILDEKITNMGIGKNSYIENAILDKDCRIANDVQIIGHEDLEDIKTKEYMIRDGIVVIRKGVTIKAGTKIGYKVPSGNVTV
jgi:glucose-1-phosphate adenylyltransferase